MSQKRRLVEADILPMAEYAKIRAESRKKISARKQNRRVEVGPYVTFYFENYDTMWMQVHEMLFIEKGGAAQIPDEIAAYGPLIPQEGELVATFMIEIDDADRRKRVLGSVGGIENSAFFGIGDLRIPGRAETDQDRTRVDGKASSVQFVHFDFTPDQIAAFRVAGAQIVLGFSHPNYGHMALLPETIRAELAQDFD